MKLFGFNITSSKDREEQDDQSRTIVPIPIPDGSSVIEVGPASEISIAGHYGNMFGQSISFDADNAVGSEQQLITKYREASLVPEVEFAIDDIINEMVTTSENTTVSIDLDSLDYSLATKSLIEKEFEHIVNLLDFNNNAFEVVKRWYVDGRTNYQVIVDPKTVSETGISSLVYIDPRQIKKVSVVRKEKDLRTSADVYKQVGVQYIFSETGFGTTISGTAQNDTGVQLSEDSVVQITSGLLNASSTIVLSYLHKVLRPLNQLKALEDASLIYRISRAPERRVFYIDVGNLPPAKAEQVLKAQAERYRSKMVYDVSSGTVRTDPKMMVMTEDFFLPRRSDGKATEITTLPGGQNLGEMNEIQYFLNKVYKALSVPISRLDPQSGFNFGRVTEISRDEVKFMHFVGRLRKKFSGLFIELLRRQLMLKNIMTAREFDSISPKITFEFNTDSIWEEAKWAEVMSSRMDLLTKVEPYKGRLFSEEWIMRNILKFSQIEIDAMNTQINTEVKAGLYPVEQQVNDPSE